MFVKIGQYKSWIGPYQIADLLQYVGVSKDKCHTIGEKLSATPLNKICTWIDSKRKRKEIIRIDKFDSWSMDHTLGMIALPMLKQLRDNKHGAPWTDDEDVPEYLKSTNAAPKQNDYDTDSLHFDRWDWIMDEMIWAFEQKVAEDSEGQFVSYLPETKEPTDTEWFFPKARKDESLAEFNNKLRTVVVDHVGMGAFNARKRNGFKLFGKYYENLWD